MSEGSFLEYVQETVTILRPMRSIVPRGKASINRQSPTMSFRLEETAQEEIKQAAELLNMPHTSFVRWAAHATAVEILKQKNEYDKRQR